MPMALPIGSTIAISPDRRGGALLGPVPMILLMNSSYYYGDFSRRWAGAWEGGGKAKREEKTSEETREACQKRGEGAGGV